MDHGYSALFGALIGFIASTVPDMISMLREHFQHKRDLRDKEQELKAASQGYEFVIASQHSVIENQAAQIEQLFLLQEDAKTAQGQPVVQFLRSSVRPVLTYSFFGLFAAIKLYAMFHAARQGMSTAEMLPILWDVNTESLFAAVISFWFGSRAITLRAGKAPTQTRATDGLRGRNADGPISGEDA